MDRCRRGTSAFAVFVSAMFLSTVFAGSVAAAELGEIEIAYDIRPTGLAFDTIVNRGAENVSTNWDTWITARAGIYVGSYIPESQFSLRHQLEEPLGSYALVQYDVMFDAGDIASGMSVVEVRLPFNVETGWNVTLSLRRLDTSVLLLDEADVVKWTSTGIQIMRPDFQNRGIGLARRSYLTLHVHLLSDVEYRWIWNITDMPAGSSLNFFMTEDDVADDGEFSGAVLLWDEINGVPGWTSFITHGLADLGHSYLFIEGSPRNGYIGTTVDMTLGYGDKLYLRRGGIDLSAHVDIARDYIVWVPVYNAIDVDITARVEVWIGNLSTGSSTRLMNETLTWRDGLIVRFTNQNLSDTVIGDDTGIMVVYEPLDTSSDDVIVVGGFSDAVFGSYPQTAIGDDRIFVSGLIGSTLVKRERYYRPTMKIQVFNATVSADSVVQGSSEGVDVETSPQSSATRFSTLTSAWGSSIFSAISCSTFDTPFGSPCDIGLPSCVTPVECAAQALSALSISLDLGGFDFIDDVRKGLVSMQSNMVSAIRANVGGILDTVATWGSSITGVLQRVYEALKVGLGNLVSAVMLFVFVAWFYMKFLLVRKVFEMVGSSMFGEGWIRYIGGRSSGSLFGGSG